MKYTIKDFKKDFPTDDKCLEYIFANRYGANHVCKCSKSSWHKVTGRKVWACAWCASQLHPLADTIFHKSDTPLSLWFFAIFLMSQSKNGVSAKELQRHLGVTYKTAWRMAKQIRSLMEQGHNPLKGIVEVDETYVGGKRKGIRGRGAKSKVPVVGLVERKGKLRAKAVIDTTRYTITPIVKQNVEIGTDLMTDDYNVYGRMNKEGYNHKTINHSRGYYAQGNVHTNTIEGAWSQLKRSISGTYHAVSPKYLQSYLDEFVYQYNHRHFPVFPLLLSAVCSPSLKS